MSKVNWYGDDVQLRIMNASQKALFAIAQQVIDQAKMNITDNGQVDTGFMRNSGYAADPDQSTYSDIGSSGTYASDAGGIVDRQAAQEVEIPTAGGPVAIAAFAADYALYQEVATPFLYPALEQVKSDVPDTMIEHVKKAEK